MPALAHALCGRRDSVRCVPRWYGTRVEIDWPDGSQSVHRYYLCDAVSATTRVAHLLETQRQILNEERRLIGRPRILLPGDDRAVI